MEYIILWIDPIEGEGRVEWPSQGYGSLLINHINFRPFFRLWPVGQSIWSILPNDSIGQVHVAILLVNFSFAE